MIEPIGPPSTSHVSCSTLQRQRPIFLFFMPPLAFIASPAQLLHQPCIGLRSFGFLTFLLCSMVGECSLTWFIQCPDPPSRCLVPSTHRISFAILTTVTSPASAGDRK